MNTLKYISLFFLLAIFLNSCDEDSFTSVVEIEIPEHTPLPAVTSKIVGGSSFVTALVSKSIAITGNADFEIVEDAQVLLFKNDNLWQTLAFDPDTRQYTTDSLETAIPSDGATYRMEVNIAGFETVTATQIMPSEITVENLVYEENGTINIDGERADELSFDIIDQAGVDNYYGLRVLQYRKVNEDLYVDQIYFDIADPIVEYGNAYMILNDATFQDDKYTARLAISRYFVNQLMPGDYFEIQVFNFTRDDYLYNKTLDIYYNAEGNPFAEPVVVHDNIENGYGIFRAAAITNTIYEF